MILDNLKQKLAKEGSLILAVKVTANAKVTRVDERGEDCLKIKIGVRPEKNKANAELVKFLAKEFGVGKSKVEIISGRRARNKVLKISL